MNGQALFVASGDARCGVPLARETPCAVIGTGCEAPVCIRGSNIVSVKHVQLHGILRQRVLAGIQIPVFGSEFDRGERKELQTGYI